MRFCLAKFSLREGGRTMEAARKITAKFIVISPLGSDTYGRHGNRSRFLTICQENRDPEESHESSLSACVVAGRSISLFGRCSRNPCCLANRRRATQAAMGKKSCWCDQLHQLELRQPAFGLRTE